MYTKETWLFLFSLSLSLSLSLSFLNYFLQYIIYDSTEHTLILNCIAHRDNHWQSLITTDNLSSNSNTNSHNYVWSHSDSMEYDVTEY